MTVFRGTFLDTPRSPFTGGHLRAEADLALVVRGRRDRGPRAVHRRGARRRRRRPARRAGAARLRRHPRPLPAGPRDRRARDAAARLAGEVRPARGGAARRRVVRRLGGHRLRLRAGAGRHHDRAGLRVALRRCRGRAVHRGDPGRAAGHLRPGAVRPDPARGPVHHARPRVRRGAGAGQALARPGPDPLRRHAAVLAVLLRRPAGVGRRAAGRRARAVVHLAPQRERRGDRGRPPALRLRLHRRRTSGPGCSGRAACSPTTCTRCCPS